uniref:Uncharacterized protein MANES_06G078500 n=1 Tax=Rhizophora mucronata TaxID=61149 RepID=A0A2P2KRF5_RHIMU
MIITTRTFIENFRKKFFVIIISVGGSLQVFS